MEQVSEEETELHEDGLETYYRIDENGVESVIILKGGEVIYKGSDRRHIEEITETQGVPPKVEEGVFGKWSVIIRNTAGIISTLVVCGTSVGFWWTTNISVTQNNVWPDTMTIMLTNIGPVMIAWAVINVNKTITTIFGARDSLALVRERLGRVFKK